MTNPSLNTHAETLFVALGLPDSGRELIRNGMSGKPVREVQGRRGNVVTRFWSRKMGAHMLLESRRGEWAQAVLLEHDMDVLGYFAQPFTLSLLLKRSDGRIVSTQQYTPDFLVIRRRSLEVIEVRDDATLHSASIKSATYRMDDDGTWHYLPAAEHLAAMGIPYRLIPISRLPTTLISNISFLKDYLRPDCPPPVASELAALHTHLDSTKSTDLRSLLTIFPADLVYWAIAHHSIYVNLNDRKLEGIDGVIVSIDPLTDELRRIIEPAKMEPVLPVPGCLHLDAGTILDYMGTQYSVVLTSEREILVVDARGRQLTIPIGLLKATHAAHPGKLLTSSTKQRDGTISKLEDLDRKHLDRALRRYKAISTGDPDEMRRATFYRYKKKMALATSGPSALLACTDRISERGNRTSKLPDIVKTIAIEVIDNFYNTPTKPSVMAAYASYSVRCSTESQLRPMSYQGFRELCRKHIDVKKREGKRSNYQSRPIEFNFDDGLTLHGSVPHEVVYVDHTTADILLTHKGQVLGKPTLSVAIDGCTRQVRAFTLSFDKPSTALVLLLMRDYVRRNQRLPRKLAVDNGKEFHSGELENFCSIYQIEIQYRPPAMPRGGALIERVIGAITTEVFEQLPGNTKQLKNPRQMTKAVAPENFANSTLTSLHGAITYYIDEVLAKRVNPGTGLSPNDLEDRKKLETGSRPHTIVNYDSNLKLMTSHHAPKPYHTICRQRGVWVNGNYYWHPKFAERKRGQLYEVRIEPWLASVIYVYFDNCWVAAVARKLQLYEERTTREVQIAMIRAEAIARSKSTKDKLSPENLRKREILLHPEHFDSRLAMQQTEMAYLYRRLDMAEALPVPVEVHTEAITDPGDVVDSAVPVVTEPRKVTASEQQQITANHADDPFFNEQFNDIMENCHGVL